MMKVNSRSLAILFDELPWAEKIIPPGADEFRAKIMDLDVLSLVPRGDNYYSEQWTQIGKVLLLDQHGQLVGQVGEFQVPEGGYRWDIFTHILPQRIKAHTMYCRETVEEALQRFGDKSAGVRYIVEFTSRWDHPSLVIIHKIPKSIPNLREWLDIKADEEIQKLKVVLGEA